jgi:hypothetical protein
VNETNTLLKIEAVNFYCGRVKEGAFKRFGGVSRRLEGKVAIVTDAGSGIGKALAKRGRTPFAHKFAQEGAKVVVNGLPDVPVQKVAEASNKYGGEAIASTDEVSEASHAQAGFNGVSQNSPYGGTKGQMHSFIKGVANKHIQTVSS